VKYNVGQRRNSVCGQAVRVLKCCNLKVMSSIPALTARWIVLGSPRFNSSVMLVNTQVCRWTVGFLNSLGHNENYWFTSNCVTPSQSSL